MLKITGGLYRNRKLVMPPSEITRPTAQRTRHALFNVLLHADWCGKQRLAQSEILDVFAGSGALGLEALSFGARHATFFEQNPKAYKFLSENCAKIGAEKEQIEIFKCSALHPPKKRNDRPYPDILFFDPPYGCGLIEKTIPALRKAGWISESADQILVAETACEQEQLNLPENATILFQRRFGIALITIFKL